MLSERGGPPPAGMLTEVVSLHDAGEQTALLELILAVLIDEQPLLSTTRASNVNTNAAP